MKAAALLVAAIALCAVAVAGARATTKPGMLYVVGLVVTNKSVVFRGDKFMTKSMIPHYPRGADVRYEVENHGTRPFSLDILGSVTGRINPGQKRSILVYWSQRGRFVFRLQPGGPKIRIWVV